MTFERNEDFPTATNSLNYDGDVTEYLYSLSEAGDPHGSDDTGWPYRITGVHFDGVRTKCYLEPYPIDEWVQHQRDKMSNMAVLPQASH